MRGEVETLYGETKVVPGMIRYIDFVKFRVALAERRPLQSGEEGHKAS